MANCSNCGNELKPNMKFCNNCGTQTIAPPTPIQDTPPIDTQPTNVVVPPQAPPMQAQGMPQQGMPQQGMPQQAPPMQAQSMPQQAPPMQAQSMPQQAPPMQAQGMPQQGMPQQGMPPQGMPQQGMPQQGMPQQGMPQQGMPQQGMPQQGMPQQMQNQYAPVGVATATKQKTKKPIVFIGIGVAALLVIILIIVLISSLFSGSSDDAPHVGLWNATEVSMMGITIKPEELYPGGITLELKANNDCILTLDGSGISAAYEIDGTTIILKQGGDEFDGTLIGNELKITNILNTGLDLVFEKEGSTGGDLPTGGSSVAVTDGSSEAATDTQTQPDTNTGGASSATQLTQTELRIVYDTLKTIDKELLYPLTIEELTAQYFYGVAPELESEDEEHIAYVWVSVEDSRSCVYITYKPNADGDFIYSHAVASDLP